MNKFKLSIILLVLMSCGNSNQDPITKNYNCHNVMLSNQNEILSQNGMLPVKIYLNKSVPESFRQETQIAILTWNKFFKTELIILSDEIDQSDSFQSDLKSVIYFTKTWDDKDKDQTAKTDYKFVNSTIIDADIVFNLKHSQHSIFLKKNSIHFRSLLIHELGHLLGLDHNNNYRSVMFPVLNPGEIKVDLSEEDVTNIKCVYERE